MFTFSLHVWIAREVGENLRGDVREEAIDIFDHIDKKELCLSYDEPMA